MMNESIITFEIVTITLLKTIVFSLLFRSSYVWSGFVYYHKKLYLSRRESLFFMKKIFLHKTVAMASKAVFITLKFFPGLSTAKLV